QDLSIPKFASAWCGKNSHFKLFAASPRMSEHPARTSRWRRQSSLHLSPPAAQYRLARAILPAGGLVRRRRSAAAQREKLRLGEDYEYVLAAAGSATLSCPMAMIGTIT